MRAAQDADAVDDAASITHMVAATSSADEYDSVRVSGVRVTVTDNDVAQNQPDRSPTFASRTVDDQIYAVGEDIGTVSLPSALGGRRQAAIQLVARPARGAALQLGPHDHRHAQGDVPQDAVHLYDGRFRR